MVQYFSEPDLPVQNHSYVQYPLNSDTMDSGDIELGITRQQEATSSSLSTAVATGNGGSVASKRPTSPIRRPGQVRRGNSKSGIVNCVTTGKEVVRTQAAFVRSEYLQEPRTKSERRSSLLMSTRPRTNHQNGHRVKSASILSNPSHEIMNTQSSKHGMYMVSSRNSGSNGIQPFQAGENSERSASIEQYCLQKVPTTSRTSRILKWFGFGGGKILSIYDSSQTQTTPCFCCGFELNMLVINFFHWLFRQTFTTVILTLSACFMGLSLLFAVGIYVYGVLYPKCVVGVDFSQTQYFTDAFILSWTTLSTCGYGAVQPVIPDKVGQCLPITIIMAFEGFMGVLIAGLVSAIFFAKVSRVQNFAQVDFSEVVCIRYGYGLNDENPLVKEPTVAIGKMGLADESSSAIDLELNSELPCPVLEFRIVNRMHNIPGGEIVEARVGVVASIDSANVSSHVDRLRDGMDRATNKTMKRRTGKRRHGSRSRAEMPHRYSLSERVASMRTMPRLDENCERPEIPRTVLTKLECESLDHPFFKRVFTVRHRLDEFSPLLKIGAKLMVQANNGYWPQELNDAHSVRASIQFDELIIRLTGLSNADANTVFSNTVYDFNDLRVGYQFNHMLFRSPYDGSLQANTSLLSSVIEQDGGGGEVLKSDVNIRKVRDVSMRL